MTEEQIKKEMGDKYHICSECSMDNDTALRKWCRRNQPITVGDMEDAIKEAMER